MKNRKALISTKGEAKFVKTRLKQISIIICATLFLVSQKGVILANASEVSAKENDLTTEAISTKEEIFR